MSFPAPIAQAILDTVIGRLAPLFLAGANGVMTAARDAARQMLAAYNPEAPDELGLAAEIISLQLHTLEALGYAADPDLPLNRILRLRGSAVSLSRESHKAQRKLDQLQRARQSATAPKASAAMPQISTSPKIEHALDLIEAARAGIQTAHKTAPKIGHQNWSRSLQQRQTASRIANNLRKNQARHANLAAHLDPAAAGAPSTAHQHR